MSDLLPVADALAMVLDGVQPLDVETVPLAESGNRVLAADITASRTQPPFPASAMDGYAVRAEDVKTAPVTLSMIGQSAAGHRFRGTVEAGECVRIFTGAPVPDGADTIIIQENAVADGHAITVRQGADCGRYVRPIGYDFSEGETLLRAGSRIDAGSVSLAAAMNQAHLPVFRRPVVAIIASGDELIAPGNEPKADQIIASNTFGVAHLVQEAGGTVRDCGIAADNLPSLQKALDRAAGADIVITLGGASVGDHDLVKQALEGHDVSIGFWKLAMRPGKPVMFGHADRETGPVRHVGLPGNPVSSLVGTLIFIVPLIRAMLDLETDLPFKPAVLARDLPANDRREEYMRATSIFEDGQWQVTPFDIQDSSLLSQYAKADCLMVRPAHAPPASKGDPCRILRL